MAFATAKCSDAGADRSQQERRQVRMIGRLQRFGLGRGDASDRRGTRGGLCGLGGMRSDARLRLRTAASTAAPGLALAAWLAAAARSFLSAFARSLARLQLRAGMLLRITLGLAFGEWNALSDQLFDRHHRFLVEPGNDRNRGAAA